MYCKNDYVLRFEIYKSYDSTIANWCRNVPFTLNQSYNVKIHVSHLISTI